MKQEKEKDPKVVVVGHSQSTPSTRLRASPKPPKPDVSPAAAPGGLGLGLKARSRSVPNLPTDTNKVRRSLVLSKPKSGEEVLMGHSKNEEVKTLGRSGNRQSVMEQFIRPKRRVNDLNESDREKKELQDRVNSSENLVKSLQTEVVELKAELEKLRNFNVELESKNIQFAQDLAAAQEKISSFSSSHDQKDRASQKPQTSNFKDVQKLIAKKLENFVVTKSDGKEGRVPSAKIPKPVSSVIPVQYKVPMNSAPPTAMPPPPPPPPLPRVPTRVSAAKKAPSLVEFYHTLTKREERKDSLGPVMHNSRATNNAHNSIVGEIQNRSTHLLAIKQDVETKGEFIQSLIEKIQTAAYAEIEDVLKFVDWLDSQLSTLADERAVLKHFNWPERKADAMREAAIEYRDLKRLEVEVSSYKDDFSLPCEASLKKITGLLDKSERSIQRLIKLRESTKASYRECKIPMDWMLDSGMVYKIKQGSMKLAKLYMKRVSVELQSFRSSERESTQEALVLQGVRFAYRAHQFAGGLDSETMCAFEEIRQRVPTNMGGSRELLAGIVS